MAVNGMHPRMTYPRIPGHEVIGRIEAVGPGVEGWSWGQRVGVGFNHGPKGITGLTVDGGYAEYMLADARAMITVGDTFDAAETAPLMCAGVTTFSALRDSGARPGDVVAVLGMGGLGHLAIQFARHFGYRTVALTGTAEKADLARQLGAHDVIHMGSTDPIEALLALGGARVILATAPNSGLISELVRALRHDGQLITVVGGGEPLRIDPGEILGRRLAIRGWRVDDPQELPRTLAFSQLAGIRARVEVYPLDDVNRAFQRMMDGEVKFRAVLVPHSGGA